MSEPRFTVGRAADCDVVLADETVSRRHAELTFLTGGRLLVVDCRSTHGTALVVGEKHRPITQEWVAPDATLEFGDLLMPVAQLVEALRHKHPTFDPGVLQAPGEPGRATAAGWAKGTRLVRCACGTLKPRGGACQACGE
jgi:pSer/pThr/pTyr-binding forkhead associated (FHA) protein